MLLLPEAAMRNVSVTQEQSDEVGKKDGRTGGHNSKSVICLTAKDILSRTKLRPRGYSQTHAGEALTVSSEISRLIETESCDDFVTLRQA